MTVRPSVAQVPVIPTVLSSDSQRWRHFSLYNQSLRSPPLHITLMTMATRDGIYKILKVLPDAVKS